MGYLIGVVLASGVVGFAAMIGLDCGRAFYPTVLIVISSYYLCVVRGDGSLPANSRNGNRRVERFFSACDTRI